MNPPPSAEPKFPLGVQASACSESVHPSAIPQSEIRTPQSDVADLTALSQAAAIAERHLLKFFHCLDNFGKTPTPAMLNLGIDTLARLTAIRKSLIRMSRIPTNLSPTDSQKFVVPPSGGTTTSESPSATPFPQIPQSAISNPQSHNPHTPLATFPPEDAFPPHPIQQGERPSVFLNHDQLCMSCPDPEPRLNEIREIARVPFSHLAASITRALEDIKALPEKIKPLTHPVDVDKLDSISSSLSESLAESIQSISSIQSILQSAPQTTEPPPPDPEDSAPSRWSHLPDPEHPISFKNRPFGTFYVDVENLPEGHPLLRQRSNNSP